MTHDERARALVAKIPMTQDAHWWADKLIAEAFAAVERETLERAVSIWEHEKHTYCDFYYEGLTELDPRKKPDWMKDE